MLSDDPESIYSVVWLTWLSLSQKHIDLLPTDRRLLPYESVTVFEDKI